MATIKEQQDYLATIVPLIQKYAPQYGIKVVSPIIAQACNECGWGTDDLARTAHNYFGLKAKDDWKGKVYTKKTQEEFTPGVVDTITDTFRWFDSMEDGVRGYFEYLNRPAAYGRYDNLRGITDPYKYIQTIYEDGYCMRTDYVPKLTKLVNDYNLTQYDTTSSGGGQSVPKLFMIAGHGAGDPGASGNGYNEAERVRALAQRIYDLAPAGTVQLGNFNRNYYADNGVSNLNVDKDTLVVELHMDSADSSAKGAHVIIKDTYQPDWYDKALADGLAAYMPGRAEKIVKRGNLANINRAAAKGINYRLVENGFITNSGDVAKFNDLDALARIYLEAAGITPVDNPNNSEGEDMALSDNDVQRIAAAVWAHFWDGDSAGARLKRMHDETMRKDDPTGRNIKNTTHEQVMWEGKALSEMAANLDAVKKKMGA